MNQDGQNSTEIKCQVQEFDGAQRRERPVLCNLFFMEHGANAFPSVGFSPSFTATSVSVSSLFRPKSN